tara:strand:+ start:3897 stop:4298 length:402 start_codon:yes stop_codon:yes gene_type:complete
MDRKTFIRKATVGLLIAAPVYSLLNCSGSDDDPNPDPNPDPDPDPNPSGNCLNNGTNSSISANHGHTLTVSKEDVAAGAQKTYQLTAASTDSHIHSVTLTANQFNSLKTNTQISTTSTSGSGHTHTVTVSCAG